MSEHSVTQYIEALKKGDPQAAQRIWERFLRRLITLADRKLKASPRSAVNEEDVVQLAFAEFFNQVQQDRFPKLDDRHDLWQILTMLVDRRAKDQIRKLNRQKAGGGKVYTQSILLASDESNDRNPMANIPDLMPTPHMVIEFAELFRERLSALNDAEYSEIALLKMQGYTNQQIAEKFQLSLRTIERRLEDIRLIWTAESADEH